MAEDLLQLCSELRVRDALFVGHTVSGVIGVLAAIHEPERFRKLALLAASPRYLNEPGYVGGLERDQLEGAMAALSRDYTGWCDATVPIPVAEPADSELTRDILADFKRVDPDIARHFSAVMFFSDHRADLCRMQHEALVVQAANDPFVPTQVAQYLVEQLPQARLEVLPGRGGHYPHLGAPDQVVHALRQFFAN